MERGQMVLVSCTIEAGAFSGERVFRLKLVDGTADYSGVAPVRYCFTAEQATLGRDQPPRGHAIEGFVEAFLISNGGDQATVELPDGEAVRVNLSQVPFRQAPGRKSKYVPV